MDYQHKGFPQSAAESQSLTKGPAQPALYANQKLHPTKVMQDNMLIDRERKQLQELSVMYGSAFAQSRVIEANIMAQVQRPSGYRSNNFGLNHHLGRFDELTFMDTLNDPSEVPCIDAEGQRARLEHKLGMY
jgi:hypothetical protein